MKQKLFTLLTLALFFCGGAWATSITIATKSGSNGTGTWSASSGSVTGTVPLPNDLGNISFSLPKTGSDNNNVGSNYVTWKKNEILTVTMPSGCTASAIQMTFSAQDKGPANSSKNEGDVSKNISCSLGTVAKVGESTTVVSASGTATSSFTVKNTMGAEFRLTEIVLTYSSGPMISVAPTSANPFTYVVGNGPSDAQTFTVTGSNLTSTITATLSNTSAYEMKIGANEYAAGPLTDLTSGTTVQVRLKSGLAKGNSYSGNLTFSSTGADNKVVALSGSVTNQTYSVTYNLNGASGDAPTETAKEEDEVFALAAAPTWDCHTFNGWLCNIDGNTYAAGDDYTMTAAPTTFTAQWTANYASGSYNFMSGMTIGTSPSKTITKSDVVYDAFQIDNLFFSSMKIGYDDGGTSDTGDGDNFNGWKIKTKDGTIKFVVENDQIVIIGIGSIGSGGAAKIDYTNLSGVATSTALSAATNNKFMVKGGTIVTITHNGTDGKTVTLKRIIISDYETISTAATKTFATYVTTNALDFSAVSDDIKAYVAASTASAGSITFTGKDEVPASTPLLIKTTSAGATVNVPIVASADAVGTNYLVAGDGSPITYDDSDPNPANNHYYYILTNGQFKAANNSVVAVGKAYLSLPSAVSANELTINFDDEEAGDVTGIATVSSKKQNNGEYYNLNGQRVDASHKGIVIVNGKKFFNK